jgi:hypothetical protein
MNRLEAEVKVVRVRAAQGYPHWQIFCMNLVLRVEQTVPSAPSNVAETSPRDIQVVRTVRSAPDRVEALASLIERKLRAPLTAVSSHVSVLHFRRAQGKRFLRAEVVGAFHFETNILPCFAIGAAD